MNSKILLAGPSGVGKNTVIREWERTDPRVKRVITHTTRKPRPEEIPGVDYVFITEVGFSRLDEAGAFLDQTRLFGARYGLTFRAVEDAASGGFRPVIEVDGLGALRLKRLWPASVSVFIAPRHTHELRRRLEGRPGEDAALRAARLAQADADMALAQRFDFMVVNTVVEAAVAELMTIVDRSIAQE